MSKQKHDPYVIVMMILSFGFAGLFALGMFSVIVYAFSQIP